MPRLTDRRLDYLVAINAIRIETGLPARYRDIAERVGVRSTNAVSDALLALKRLGMVSTSDANGHAGTVITDSGLQQLGYRPCTHCGQMAIALKGGSKTLPDKIVGVMEKGAAVEFARRARQTELVAALESIDEPMVVLDTAGPHRGVWALSDYPGQLP